MLQVLDFIGGHVDQSAIATTAMSSQKGRNTGLGGHAASTSEIRTGHFFPRHRVNLGIVPTNHLGRLVKAEGRCIGAAL